jgi:hypothetical protein
MDILTADFETYYDKDFSLSKLTMEHYIRDPRFEVIMLGLRWPDGTKEIVTGSHEEVQYRLDGIEWGKYAVLCHNTLFDAAILAWRFGVNPAAWLDTLSMPCRTRWANVAVTSHRRSSRSTLTTACTTCSYVMNCSS